MLSTGFPVLAIIFILDRFAVVYSKNEQINMKYTVILSACCLLMACHGSGDKTQSSSADSTTTQPTESIDVTADTAKTAVFDLDKVPLSDAQLGAFPYFNLPEGYALRNSDKPKDFERFPFWVGDHYEWAEGKLFYSMIDAKEGKEFSKLEVSRNLDNLIKQAGGVKVFEGKIPSDSTHKLNEDHNDITVAYVDGFGDFFNNPVSEYVIHRTDKTIWIHLCLGMYNGSISILETKAFEQTATMIPADELKKEIDAKGKAIIHVNFDTDKSTILADSKPQLDQVKALLQQEPTLKLAINGYTDNTGEATHNLQLSDDRAKSVLHTLVTTGIDQSRLQAKGFGQSDPVGDNATEEGKAQNRRVELIKI